MRGFGIGGNLLSSTQLNFAGPETVLFFVDLTSVELTPGETYSLFATDPNGSERWGVHKSANFSDPYSGGQAFTVNTLDSNPTATPRSYDLYFSVVPGSAGPELAPIPAALPLLLTGLAGLGLIGWRKRMAV